MKQLIIFAGVLSTCYAAYRDISDNDLSGLMTSLWTKDINIVARSSLGLQLQGRVNSHTSDAAPGRLFGSNLDSAISRGTYPSLTALLNSFDSRPGVNSCPSRATDVQRFLSNIFSTDVGKTLDPFLRRKGLVPDNDTSTMSVLREMWFGGFSRSCIVPDSSGFKHVFVGEENSNGGVGGLHNWVRFMLLERSGRLDYKGYYWFREPGVIKLKFSLEGVTKPVSSMFVGTSPELEISMYTVCALARPNSPCNFRVNNLPISIKVCLVNYNTNKTVISTAYPDGTCQCP